MKYRAQVVPGQGRGKSLGFPTFNLEIPPHFSPRPGIYACRVWLGEKAYGGALHFGPVPVFNEPQPTLEIFVLDYSLNSGVKRLTFQLLKYLRPIKNFSSPESLKRQIAQDIARVSQLLHPKSS
ncbi:MAG: riboflavin kinase [Candidatus Chisholmbacteria bacterium]|nr:riboflavin kinase [Candidatus Chisholmbacteria bacterium]